ncbi:RagB/SusD family nutrient uptake outer membrane protein [Chitinophaga nivalis]|uniref:RagB/SusD family nutrient uptake outer membrane protein n=1 Tax=Chitinophaga nivalis TaxID=2991709 RepID=A0ABT3IW53_9BACT|nr:RagB/SusD family nutrient uptake outer membrane protein [Chitinophaga nivalis]MCW3462106.1 RagB/SusD family nutrient uptake outer membrane protein [Chitinophaga nivalis]MCW3488202.1 RagB/SusD family nutrient uptake outer membrane protein [Chitinophaga nivalis]
MKKQIIAGAALLMTFAWSGCSKDFLNRIPEDKVTTGQFWNTLADATNALNGVYGGLGYSADVAHLMDGQNAIYDDGASDNAHAQYPWESNASAIALGNITTTENDGWDFTPIRRANALLENIDRITAIEPGLRNRLKAEAKVLRAFFYMGLTLKFGDVPLITATNQGDLPRDNKEKIVKFVFDELDAAAAVLPESYPGGYPNEKGRVTKGAALALAARFHLYRNDYANALKYAKSVMAIPGYQLFKINAEDRDDAVDNYKLWVDFTNDAEEKRFRLGMRSYEQLFWAANKGNAEVIFDRQHTFQKDVQSENTYLPPAFMGGWSSVTPTQDLVNAYADFKTGEPRTGTIDATTRAARYAARKDLSQKPTYYDEFRNLDPRFYATVMYDSSTWNKVTGKDRFKWAKGSNNSKTGYNFRKLVDPAAYPNYSNWSNHIIIRYAEILLTYAEASIELGTIDASVYDAIDQIRERAGMAKLDRSKYNSQQSLRNAVRQERRIELALEGNRYMDIRRWGIAATVMNKTIYAVDGGSVETRTWASRLMLLPVPQSAIDKNARLLPNNPGY